MENKEIENEEVEICPRCGMDINACPCPVKKKEN